MFYVARSGCVLGLINVEDGFESNAEGGSRVDLDDNWSELATEDEKTRSRGPSIDLVREEGCDGFRPCWSSSGLRRRGRGWPSDRQSRLKWSTMAAASETHR